MLLRNILKIKSIITFLFIFLLSSGDVYAFKEGTTFWYKHASHSELVRHYSKMDLDEICAMWKEVGYWKKKRRVPNRNAMKEALLNIGEDKYFCMKIQNQ